MRVCVLYCFLGWPRLFFLLLLSCDLSARLFTSTVPPSEPSLEHSPKARLVLAKVHHTLASLTDRVRGRLGGILPASRLGHDNECLPVSTLVKADSFTIDDLSSIDTNSPHSFIMSLVTATHFFMLAIFGLILVGLHFSDASFGDEFGVQLTSCPIECDCAGLTIDCSRRSLTSVPKPLPHEVRRM